jgi:hypothetical protein
VVGEIRGKALRCSEMSSEREESRRRPPFGLYDAFLEAERDDVYEHLSVRLKWFGGLSARVRAHHGEVELR